VYIPAYPAGATATRLEQTIMDSGGPQRVIAMREDFQRVMQARYKQTINELTGRNVVAVLSQAHVEPDITVEMCFVDGPLPGSVRSRSCGPGRAGGGDDGGGSAPLQRYESVPVS
jgi:hypothetical protein